MKKVIGSIAVILLLWGIVFYPLFGQRFIPTHDGEYHLIRIHEFSTMLKAGNLFPRWAPGLNSGYGFPLFIFHYPFPNYIGSLFHFLDFSLAQSFQISMALATLISLIGSYLFFSKEYKSIKIGLLGALCLLLVPYLYVDLYIRGSIGELWAIAWVWIALASLKWKKNLFFSFSICLLIISHNIMAMIFIPLLFLYTFLFERKFIIFIFGGIIIASYFWIPALVERQYVIGLNSVTFSDHFPEIVQLLIPSWGSNFSQPGLAMNEMSQQIGVLPLFLLGTAVVLVIKKNNKKVLFFVVTTCIGIFFMLPISFIVWKYLPFLQYIQYPWRLLSLLLISVPFFCAFFITKANKYLTAGVIMVGILLIYGYTKPVTYEPRNDMYYLTKKEFTDGTSSLGNSFSTIWTSWIKDRPEQIVNGNVEVQNLRSTPTSLAFTAVNTEPQQVTINRTYYPGWVVAVNGKETKIDFSRGIIQILVPSGTNEIKANFQETKLRMFANGVSVLTLFSLVLFSILSQRYARSH